MEPQPILGLGRCCGGILFAYPRGNMQRNPGVLIKELIRAR
jgi:hypothetical protein